MKRLFTLIFATMLAGHAWAATVDCDFSYSGYYCKITSDSTVKIVGIVNINETEYFFPSTVSNNGKTYTVTAIASVYNTQNMNYIYAKKISIPNTIKSIGDLSGFINLTSIIINCDIDVSGAGLCIDFDKTNWNSIKFHVLNKNEVEVTYKSVNDYSLKLSTYQGDIIIPQTINAGNTFTITRIGENAFYGESRTLLKSITIPNSVTSVGNSAFRYCESLTSIIIPNSVRSIESRAFEGCINLTSISFPNTVINIGTRVFYNCTGLKFVTFSNSIRIIGDEAFKNCTNLTSVSIPDSILNIGSDAFSGCNDLEYTLYKGCKYLGNDVNTHLALWQVKSKDISSVEFHKDCKVICADAFSGFTNLTELTIPDSIVGISNNAFKNCTGLTSIAISDSLKYIGTDAFLGCNNLTSIITNSDVDFSSSSLYFTKDGIRYKVLSKNTVSVASHSYSGDVVIPSTVTIGNTFSVTSIEREAFKNCKRLTSITIPNSVTDVGYEAFYGCNNLTKAEFPSVAYLCNLKFDNNSADSNPLLHAHNLYINGEMVTDLVIPDTVTSIGKNTFRGCDKLTSVTIPNSITDIGIMAFYGCTGLTSIYIPESVVKIGSAAIPTNNSIRTLSFNTNAVGAYFSNETNLEEIIIGDAVTSIAENAFANCDKLKAVVIPASVTEIGANAFKKNTGQIICLAETPIELSADPFPNNETIFVPASSVDAYSSATVWKRKEILPWYTITATSDNELFGKVETAAYCGENENAYIKAVPAEGYHLTHWSDGYNKTIWDKKVEQDISLVAYFAIDTFNFVAQPNDSAFGNISGTGLYTYGANVELEAVSAAHYHFVKWSDDSTATKRSFVANTDVNLSAIFEIDKHGVSLTTTGEGSVTGIGDYNYGDTITIIATPKTSSHFVKWNDNVTEMTRRLVVSQDSNLIAIFEEHTISVDSAVSATCIATGLTEGSHCAVCGKILMAQETIAATGQHTIVIDARVEPTCIGTGLTEGSHCSVCNKIIVAQDTLEAVEWKHTIVVDEKVEPTCTETGLTEGTHCSICNLIIKAQDTLACHSATTVTDRSVSPTCTEPGLTGGRHCSVCGEIIVAQKEKPALGHEFVNYVYNNDATTEADGTETAVCEHGCGTTDTRVAEGTKLPKDNTAVSESAADKVLVYAHGSKIVVENATEEISVYDVMGRLVGRGGRDVPGRVSTETTAITVNTTGIYIVKTGGTVKRVMVK